MKNRSGLLSLTVDWLLASATAVGGLYCLITAFGLTVNSPVLCIWIAAFAGLQVFCLSRKKWGVFALLTGAIFLLACLYYRTGLGNEAKYVWQTLLNLYQNGYDWLAGLFSVELVEPGMDVTGFFAALAVPVVWLLCLGLVRCRRAVVGFLAVLPLVTACYVLIDTPPAAWALLVLSGALLLQFFTQNIRRRAPKSSGGAVLYLLLPTLLLLALAVHFDPPQTYERADVLERISAWADSVAQSVDYGDGTGQVERPNPVELNTLDAQSQSNRVVMYVTSDVEGVIYLRGTAYSGFDGRQWTARTDRDWSACDGAGATLSGGSRETFSVRVATLNKQYLLYTPYYLAECPAGVRIVSDAYLINDGGETDYTLSCGVQPELSAAAAEAEDDYRQAVYEDNLYLPEETKQALLALAEQAGISDLPRQQQPQAVAEYVRSAAEYDIAPEVLPQGEDFCVWFLTQAKTGYCVHFATAATAMLRALEIPARYVTGYAAWMQAGQATPVTQAQAHAWTEYYVDGWGWIRLEATPGSAQALRQTVTEEQTETGETQTATTHTDAGQTGAQTETGQTRPTEAETTRPDREPDGGAASGQQTGGDGAKLHLPWWLWVVLAVLALPAVLVLRRQLVLSLWRRRLKAAEGNEKALLYWRRLEKLCRCLHRQPEDDLRQLAQRARFSQHSLTQEELERLSGAVTAAQQTLAAAPVGRRLYYRYILALI